MQTRNKYLQYSEFIRDLKFIKQLIITEAFTNAIMLTLWPQVICLIYYAIYYAMSLCHVNWGNDRSHWR